MLKTGKRGVRPLPKPIANYAVTQGALYKVSHMQCHQKERHDFNHILAMNTNQIALYLAAHACLRLHSAKCVTFTQPKTI